MLIIFEGETAARDTFRFLEEKLSAGIWSWNVESDRMHWSVGLFRLLGFEANSIQPSFDLFASLVLPDDRKTVAGMERLVRRGLEFDGRFRVTRRDGRIRTIDVKSEPLTSHSTNELLAVGVIRDVTSEVTTEALAKDLEDRYQALIEAAGGTIWAIRPDGWATERKSATPTARPDDGLGFAWRELVHPEDIEGLESKLSDAVSNSRGYEYELRLRQPDESYRWFRARGAPLRSETGEVRELIGVTTSVQAERILPEQAPAAEDVITGAQIRAARGLVNWSVQDLSLASGVSASTIRRFEASDSFCHGAGREESAIKQALAKSGVKFYFHRSSKPAVAPK